MVVLTDSEYEKIMKLVNELHDTDEMLEKAKESSKSFGVDNWYGYLGAYKGLVDNRVDMVRWFLENAESKIDE